MAGEDPEHLHRLRRMPCAVEGCGHKPPVDAHHPTGSTLRGMSQRAHDHLAIPMCHHHHMEFHGATGYFRRMLKAERKAWQATMSERYMPSVPSDDVF